MTGNREAVMAQDCESCGKEIGMQDYVTCWDGISSKVVTFHKGCTPQMSDVQRNHGVHIGPGKFGLTLKGLG
jgi:hypothetical protein